MKFRAGTLSLQVSETVEDCISDEDEVSAASYNESILECEKELLVTTLIQKPSLILLLPLLILVDSSNYDDTGRFTNFNPNVIKRSVSKIYV